MSDTETPEQSASTPTPQPTPKAKGRGRGRGRKPAVPKKEIPKPAPTAGTGRRGRFKTFTDDKVQACYERQRELKAQYAALANAVKPALQDLSTRSVKRLTRDNDYYQSVPEFDVVKNHLQERFAARIAVAERKLAIDQKMVLSAKDMQHIAVQEIFENEFAELEEKYLNAQIHRLDILEYLYDHRLPIDLVDGGWNYKPISDKEASEFGLYEVYVDGHLVPYPQLVEGTEAYALRQAAWAEPQPKEAAAAPAAAPRTKRKAREQPDGQPASKRTAGDVAPANHIAGIMSAQHAPVEDESNESTPIPDGPVAADQREPPLPAKASEPDEYGCRQVNRPAAKNGAMIANRIIVPPAFQYDDDEIGYRDSTNSAKHGATVAKRGKYFGKPNTNTWHYDPLLARWDARLVEDDDMDKELVEKHGVHPRYGYFLPTSKNDAEPPKPEANPMAPTVYLTPSGLTLHASRYVPAAKVEAAIEEKPFQDQMAAVLSAVCEQCEITDEDIEGEELKQLKEISAEYAEQRALAESIKESESVEETPAGSPLPSNDSALNIAGLDDLVSAAKAIEQEEAQSKPVDEKPVVVQPPTPARTSTRAYDAIRDIFGDSEPATESTTPVIPSTSLDTSALMALADASTGEYRPQPIDVTMADAPPMNAAPMDLSPHNAPHHIESTYPMQSAHDSQMSIPPNNSWVEPRLASPGPESQIHLSIEHQSQLPPARPVDMSQMRASIEAPNDNRRHSMYPDPNAPPPPPSYYEQHMPPPQAQQHYMSVDPMIDPRLYSAPMDGQPPAGRHDFHNTVYNQPQQSYPGMPMQGGPMGPGPQQMQQSGSSSRMPFTNPVQDRSSPLPPLRPSRGRKSASAATESMLPEPQQLQQQQPPPPYMNTNSGSFYPPGPPRPYHNGYTNEQPGMPMMQPYPPYQTNQGPPPPHPQQSYGPPGMSPTNPAIAPAQSPPALQFVQQQPNEPPTRSRAGSGSSTPSSAGNSRYPKLAPAPIPPHRVGWPTGPELRTVQYDYKENIKDYAPTEPPPRRAPIQIRGWNINNNKIQRQRAEENGDERRSSR